MTITSDAAIYTRLRDEGTADDIPIIREWASELRRRHTVSSITVLARELGFSIRGSRTDIIHYLRENLERIAMSRTNGELILAGR